MRKQLRRTKDVCNRQHSRACVCQHSVCNRSPMRCALAQRSRPLQPPPARRCAPSTPVSPVIRQHPNIRDTRALRSALQSCATSVVPRRCFASTSEDKGTAPNSNPNELGFTITPWTRFLSRPHQPLKVGIYHRIKRWWNRLSKFNIDEKEFLEGAKQAFLAISPFLVYGAPLPPISEMREMLEPNLLRLVRRARREKVAMQPGLVEVVSANILTIDVGLDEPVHRNEEGKLEKVGMRLEDMRQLLSVRVLFQTKEEVKTFNGVQQLSPTRFFDMEHMWVFVHRLPSTREILDGRRKGEDPPVTPWRLSKAICIYPNYLQIDVRNRDKTGDEEEDEE